MKDRSGLRIAIVGTRGIPACYGGFETFAEELSTRLVKRGYVVSVYGRRPFGKIYEGPKKYKEVDLIVLPTIMHKYLETPLHALMCFLDLFRRSFDVILVCNAATAPFSWLVRLRRIPFLINVDGIERKRGKWNLLGRCWYRLGEICSVLFANRVVCDAKVIADYYRKVYGCHGEVVAYGANAPRIKAGPTLAKFNLKERQYLLYVSRLEPENNALGVIQAYNALITEMPLVIVGDAPYARDYIAELKRVARSNVIFTGFQFGQAYQELQSNCYLYIQATEVGGTHPALIEAMTYGNCVVANGTPENLEVLDNAGVFYPKNNFGDLAHKLELLLNDSETLERYRVLARERAKRLYNWDRIVEQYEALFRELVKA